MGWISDIGDFVEDTAGAVVDTVVENVIDPAIAAAEAAAEAAVAAAEAIAAEAAAAAATVAEAVVDVGAALGTAAADAGDWALTVADDYLFDSVEYITGGALAIDYTGGDLSATVDYGIASVGVSVGESGLGGTVGLDIGIASAEVSIDDDGDVSSAAQVGIDTGGGPLAPVAGHLTINDEGTIDIGGRAQGTIPTPIGALTGEIEGGFHHQPDGSWGAYGDAEGTLLTPTGVTVNAGGEISYEVEADGDEVFSTGGHVGVGYVGGPAVEVGGEYHRIEDDGTVTEGGSGYVEGEGYGLGGRVEAGYDRVEDADGNVTETYTGGIEASGYGVEVEASGEYERAETADGTVTETYSSQVGASGYGLGGQAGGSSTESTTADGVTTSSSDAWVDVDGLDTDALMTTAQQFTGAAADTTAGVVGGPVATVAETVTNLAGSGDLSEAISTMADTGGQSVSEIAGNLAESGNFDDFASDVITSEVTEAVADDMWDDLTP
jgi:hypothetical protein